MNLKSFLSFKVGRRPFKMSTPNKIVISKTNGNAVVNLILYAKHPMMHVKAIIRYLRIPEISLIFKNK
jgi:hypothetical protein